MGDITLEQVQAVCGEYTSRSGYNYNFQCPICMDEHKDNLVYNDSKHIIKCFKDESHTIQVLDLINKKFGYKRKEKTHKIETKVNTWDIRKEQYIQYMMMTQDILLHDKSLLDYIYNKRGLTSDTLDLCGVGYDNTEECFTIPIFSLRYDCITDFELRKYGDKKQIKRVGGGCNTIACIYGRVHAKECYIVEGFIDGMTLVQWLIDKKHEDIIVYSCSNGVSSLVNVMNEINFSKHDSIKLILDNDEAGDKATKDIIEKYPFIKDSRTFLKNNNVNDINDYYKKFILHLE